MGNIVTFYSYKGGVGRSMALANVGLLLAQRGLKVLLVDWDLEAPGLERYFHYFASGDSTSGLLQLLLDAQAAEPGSWPDELSSCSHIEYGPGQTLDLLTSGRGHDPEYARKLERFDWDHFFGARRGGEFLEHLRETWRARYDVVLIDSRTGLSDAGGVCTIQMPDIVVAMFTATAQSVYGVRDIMRLAQGARQRLPYERMRLSVLPVPSRWATHEFREGQIWVDRIAEAMYEFITEWLPAPVTPRDVVEALKIPQHEYFSYGEKLAAVEQGVSDPTGMGFFYERIAAFLASDMQDVGALVGVDAVARARRRPALDEDESDASHAEFDVFISHDGRHIERVLEFSEALRSVVALYLGRRPKFYIDFTEVQSGPSMPDAVARALRRSRSLLALVTPSYLDSPVARRAAEIVVARRQQRQKAGDALEEVQPTVFPVWLQGEPSSPQGDDPMDIFLEQNLALDLRAHSPLLGLGRSLAWMPDIVRLGEAIALRLRYRPQRAEGESELAWRGISSV